MRGDPSLRWGGAGVGNENAESWSALQPLRIPSVIRPGRRTFVVVRRTDELMCGRNTPSNCTDSDNWVDELMKSSLLEAARSSQLFPFCGQFGAASIVSTRTWSVFNCVRSSGKENQHQKHLRIMSFQKPKAVYAANHRQCTAAGGEVPVPCGGIQELRKAWQGDWRTDCQSKLSSAWAVSLCGAAKLPVSKSAFVPILTYSNECWVMTERILSQVQVAEMEFLRWLHSATFRDKVRRCEMRKTLSAEALLRAEIPATLVWPRFQKVPGKIGEASPAGYAHNLW